MSALIATIRTLALPAAVFAVAYGLALLGMQNNHFHVYNGGSRPVSIDGATIPPHETWTDTAHRCGTRTVVAVYAGGETRKFPGFDTCSNDLVLP